MACEPCNEQVIEGTCKEFLNSDCIYVSEELTCVGVQPKTILTTALKRFDEVICQIKEKTAGTLSLVNVGGGAKIYKGLSNIGEKQIRSITSNDGTVDITEGLETIDLSVTVDFPPLPEATTTQAGIVRQATDAEAAEGLNNSTYVTPLHLKTFVDANNNEYRFQIVDGRLELLENGDVVDSDVLPTGTDTFINSFELNGTTLTIGRSDGETFSKDIASLTNFTQVQSDFTMEDTANPSYIKNRNPSKTVFANYELKASDNNYVIVVDSTSAVTITVPSALKDSHTTGFIQKSTGLVTIANVDIVPEGMVNTIKGKGHQAYVEKIEGTKFLFGNLNKAV